MQYYCWCQLGYFVYFWRKKKDFLGFLLSLLAQIYREQKIQNRNVASIRGWRRMARLVGTDRKATIGYRSLWMSYYYLLLLWWAKKQFKLSNTSKVEVKGLHQQKIMLSFTLVSYEQKCEAQVDSFRVKTVTWSDDFCWTADGVSVSNSMNPWTKHDRCQQSRQHQNSDPYKVFGECTDRKV